ncbi:MAG TPA: ribonuclease HI [Candidatus Paceibacterota bacterium]
MNDEERQKRLNGQLTGSRGTGYAEIFPNKKIKIEKITIYTDGSSKGNPGPGGYAAIIFEAGKVKEIGGRDLHTTNNRMELRAAIEALRALSGSENVERGEIEIHSDSEYLIKGITLWISGWLKNSWRTKAKKDVLNKDLWQELLEQTEKRKVEWHHVRGHADNELNNRCDKIATDFADGINVQLYDGSKEKYFI